MSYDYERKDWSVCKTQSALIDKADELRHGVDELTKNLVIAALKQCNRISKMSDDDMTWLPMINDAIGLMNDATLFVVQASDHLAEVYNRQVQIDNRLDAIEARLKNQNETLNEILKMLKKKDNKET